MKKRFLFVFILLSALMFIGCGDDNKMKGTLSAPQEITIRSDNGKSLIIFDEVKNAEYYNIYINDVARTVKSNGSGTVQFDASKIINLPQTYTIKVKAGADKYFESEFSSEHIYTHKETLVAPIISIDGKILNWNKIENADFYDVLVTNPDTLIQSSYRFSTNRFDFSNILSDKGIYSFKVKAVSPSVEYGDSIYSNQLTYTHNITLLTPYKLQANYDIQNDEQLLTFVSSEKVESFVVKIDGTEHVLTGAQLNSYLVENDLGNTYVFKLSSFVRNKNIPINNSRLLNVSIKADNNNQRYIYDSDFSDNITCQFYSVLQAPEVNITKSGDNCTINITPKGDSTYLSGFAIYLNQLKYKTISSNVKTIEIPCDAVGSAGIRVQAVSNNNNCYPSILTDAKYLETNTQTLQKPTVEYSNWQINWNSVENAQLYYVEIFNKIFKYSITTNQTSLSLVNVCGYGKYNVKVIAMADGYKQNEGTLSIECVKQLQKVTDVNIARVGDKTYLEFIGDENAYGYVMYLNGVMKDKLFVTNIIDISGYISELKTYNITIQAVGVGIDSIKNGEKSDQHTLQNIKTLASPILTITSEGDKYYLNIDVDENEASISSGYEVWINYTSAFVETELKDSVKDITSYFANAGEYHFMIQANADESNTNIKDSVLSSVTYKITKQLDLVSNILVQKSNEDKYILTFTEQTLAAKYLVTIRKAEDNTFKKQFELTTGYADISQYITENGVYRVYVKAIALTGGAYTDSPDSGNPYRIVKGETLPVAQNITFDKTADGEILVKWAKVENAVGYQIYVYYNQDGINLLKQSVYVAQNDQPNINIGSGQYKCVGKEGVYSVQIKALGDNVAYENSQLAGSAYSYVMENVVDFERHQVFMYGKEYAYKVTKLEDLKNLLWYHYLYNKDVWNYNNSLEYNLKIYFDDTEYILGKDQDNNDIYVDPIYELAREISDDFATSVSAYTNNADKMSAIALEVLRRYPEIAVYSYQKIDATGAQYWCFNEQDNIYLFRYQNELNDNKLDKVEPSVQVFKEKIETVSAFDKRDVAYTFAIDLREGVDVTTTEQLFMALQYNKKPNFVGDSAVAEAVYQNARFVLREICSDDMSDYEKVLQIYNFLSKSIVYNHNVSLGQAATIVEVNNGTTMRGNISDFYLEGVLYNFATGSDGRFSKIEDFAGQTAVCDGLSKAFVVLCSIEGIDSIKVKNSSHAWNKVYIDVDGEDGLEYTKAWYAIDITAGIQNNSFKFNGATYQVGLHNLFLVKDTLAQTASYLHKRLGDTTSYMAETEFNYYQNTICEASFGNFSINRNLVVNDEEDIINLLAYGMLKANKKYRAIVTINTKGEEDINRLISNFSGTYGYTNTAKQMLKGQYNCQVSATLSSNGRYIIIALQGTSYVN